jgi:hypothetical protein
MERRLLKSTSSSYHVTLIVTVYAHRTLSVDSLLAVQIHIFQWLILVLYEMLPETTPFISP